MGTEPNEADMPMDYNNFHYEIQNIFFIYNLLPHRIAEFSGTYLGKDFQNLGFFFDMYEVDKSWRQFYFRIMLMMDSTQQEILDKKRKAKEASQKAKKK